jgi:putative drug exporter of the RND superfamily
MSHMQTPTRPIIARSVRVLAGPIILLWLGLAAVTNIVVPQLEAVGEAHALSVSPDDAPAIQAMKRIGHVFHEFDTDSAVMIVLEGQAPLGDEAHRFYNDLIHKLSQDTKHVEHIEDFWGDPLTAAGSQSPDGKAAYVQVYLAGHQGETLANQSVDAVRRIVSTTQAPNGIRAYVAGPAAVTTDQLEFGDKSARKVMGVTIAVIVVMLLVVYRSLATVVVMLLMVFIELPAVQGVIAVLGNYGLIGLSTFAVQILPILAIAAGTDYAIFVIGRYQEARQAGEDRESA